MDHTVLSHCGLFAQHKCKTDGEEIRHHDMFVICIHDKKLVETWPAVRQRNTG